MLIIIRIIQLVSLFGLITATAAREIGLTTDWPVNVMIGLVIVSSFIIFLKTKNNDPNYEHYFLENAAEKDLEKSLGR